MAKILVVDDDLMIRVILKHTLDDHDVLMAADGRQAIALMEWEKPDLVLMDVMMPGLDGVTTAQVIQTRHQIPIVFMSALADDIHIPVGMSPTRTVNKPFDPIELQNTVNDTLSSGVVKKNPTHAPIVYS